MTVAEPLLLQVACKIAGVPKYEDCCAGAGFPVARDTMQRYKWKLFPMQRSGER
jgi:hypothetical protein